MNKLLNNLLGMYKQAKLNKKAEQQNLKQIFEEAMGNREPIIETANGVFYFEPKGDKIVFGTATNVGISQDYVFDYDFDMSFDQNIQGMAEEVLEKEGYYTESSKRTKMKRKVGTIEQQINDKKYSINTEDDNANKLKGIANEIVNDSDLIAQVLSMTKNQKEDEFSIVTLSPEKDKVLGVKYIKKDEVYDYKPNQNEYALVMTRDTGFADTDYQLQPMIMVVRSWNEGRKFYATKKNQLNKKAEEDLIEVGWDLNSSDEDMIEDLAEDMGRRITKNFWDKINKDISKVERWFLREGYRQFFTKVRDEGHGSNGASGGTAWMTENQLKDFISQAEKYDENSYAVFESAGTLGIYVSHDDAVVFHLFIYIDNKDLDKLGIESKRVSKNKKLSSEKTRKSLHKKAISGFSADVMEINERKLDEIRNTAKDMGDEIWARINENIVKIIAYGYENGKLKIVYREPYYGKEEIEEMYENADEISLADFETLELQREAKISHNLSKKADEDLNKEYKLLGNGLPTFDFNKKIIDFLDGINKKFDKFCVKIYGKIVCFNEIKDKKLITDKGEEFDYRDFGSGLLLKIYNKLNNSKESSKAKTMRKKADTESKEESYNNKGKQILKILNNLKEEDLNKTIKEYRRFLFEKGNYTPEEDELRLFLFDIHNQNATLKQIKGKLEESNIKNIQDVLRLGEKQSSKAKVFFKKAEDKEFYKEYKEEIKSRLDKDNRIDSYVFSDDNRKVNIRIKDSKMGYRKTGFISLVQALDIEYLMDKVNADGKEMKTASKAKIVRKQAKYEETVQGDEKVKDSAKSFGYDIKFAGHYGRWIYYYLIDEKGNIIRDDKEYQKVYDEMKKRIDDDIDIDNYAFAKGLIEEVDGELMRVPTIVVSEGSLLINHKDRKQASTKKQAKDDEYMSDKEIAQQYDDYKITYLSVNGKNAYHVPHFTVELELPNVDENGKQWLGETMVINGTIFTIDENGETAFNKNNLDEWKQGNIHYSYVNMDKWLPQEMKSDIVYFVINKIIENVQIQEDGSYQFKENFVYSKKHKTLNKQATIKHENGEYNVYSENGKCLGKGYKTKEEAQKRLKQVEYFKNKSSLKQVVISKMAKIKK